ncbi:transposase [Streptomyces sp. NPDC056178]|uniref:transposase n=1 Tax=unclassified Streptomyces TaxID=2593676 RepID=UPI0035DB497B
MGRGDLTNGQWARLEPLLPRGKKPGRPPTWSRRQLIDGIRWRTRTGAPWRDVPERYGPWGRAYDLQHAAGARKKGPCRRSLPAVSSSSRRTMALGGRVAG